MVKRRGNFGLTTPELIITMGLSSLLATLAYRVVIASTRSATVTARETLRNKDTQKFTDRLNRELGNAVAFLVDEQNGSSTVLGNMPPSQSCSRKGSTSIELAPSGIVAFPNFSRDDIDQLPRDPNASGGSIDPTSVTPSATKNDAIRIAFFPRDTKAYVVESSPVSDNDPIDIAEVNGTSPLAEGDFAILSDGFSSDLLRITDVHQSAGTVTLKHHSSKSVWNTSLKHSYATTSGTVVTIQKVNLVTYAMHSDRAIYMHNHETDDGFSGSSFGSPGVRQGDSAWNVAAQNMDRFQIFFETKDTKIPFLSNDPPGKRNPRATIPAKIGDCRNEIGYPKLKRVWISLKTSPNQQRPDLSTVAPLNVLLAARFGVEDGEEQVFED